MFDDPDRICTSDDYEAMKKEVVDDMISVFIEPMKGDERNTVEQWLRGLDWGLKPDREFSNIIHWGEMSTWRNSVLGTIQKAQNDLIALRENYIHR